MIETGFREIQRRAPWPADPKLEEPVDEGRASHLQAPNNVNPYPRWEMIRFQGMRVAYFCVGSDSTENKLVLNRIVSLKGDTRKTSESESSPHVHDVLIPRQVNSQSYIKYADPDPKTLQASDFPTKTDDLTCMSRQILAVDDTK